MENLRVLFVCTGDTCRSPMAEVVFSNMVRRNGYQIVAKSAGTGTQPGQYMTDEAREALIFCGESVTPDPIPSTQFIPRMLNDFDYIICMENRHKQRILKGGVWNVRAKLCTFDELTGCGEVFDPYMMPVEEYIRACRQIQSACDVLYKRITRNNE